VTVYLVISMSIALILLGWIAGMWTRRRADHWCKQCGATLKCPNCLRAGARL
jgi:hypothetical protein